MENKICVDKLLLIHREYRESYLSDINDSNKRYNILCMLMRKEINNGNATYDIEKENIKLEHIVEAINSFTEEIRDKNDIVSDIWERSLHYLLYQNISTVIKVEERVLFQLEQNCKMLEIGNRADINREKVEFVKLKIKAMNVKRRR